MVSSTAPWLCLQLERSTHTKWAVTRHLGTSEANKWALPASDSIVKATPRVVGSSSKCCLVLMALAPENRVVSRAPSQAGSLLSNSALARTPDALLNAGKPDIPVHSKEGLASSPLPTLLENGPDLSSADVPHAIIFLLSIARVLGKCLCCVYPHTQIPKVYCGALAAYEIESGRGQLWSVGYWYIRK